MKVSWTNLREKKDLTLNEAGALVGVHGATISYYEKGKSEPTFSTAVKMLEAYGYKLTVTKIGKV